MKIKGWHLIILSIIVFFTDLLTLGNRNVIDNPITNSIASIIGLLCVFSFLFGIIKTFYDFASKNKESNRIKWEQEEKQGIRATGVEIGLRKLLAIPLIISALLLIVLLPLIGLILSFPILLPALYLLFNRRYHLVFDSFLLLPGFLLYFVRIPGSINYFSLYKSIELYTCPGFISPALAFIQDAGPLAVTKYYFLTASLFLFSGDIIARLKFPHKKSLNVISFGLISLVLFLLPLLYVPKVALGMPDMGGTGGDGQSNFSTNNTSYNMSFDETLNTYSFTANILNQNSNNFASISNICVDGKIIPISKDNNMMQVENGIISDGKISVPSGQTAIIKLVSQKPFYVITLFEGLRRYSTSFLR